MCVVCVLVIESVWRDQIKEDDDDVVVIMKHSFMFTVLTLLEVRERVCV